MTTGYASYGSILKSKCKCLHCFMHCNICGTSCNCLIYHCTDSFPFKKHGGSGYLDRYHVAALSLLIDRELGPSFITPENVHSLITRILSKIKLLGNGEFKKRINQEIVIVAEDEYGEDKIRWTWNHDADLECYMNKLRINAPPNITLFLIDFLEVCLAEKMGLYLF